MATIDFPLTISEITNMKEDGDYISLFFSYACITFFVLVFILWLVYYLTLCTKFRTLSFISLSLSAICLLGLYIYRPIFLTDEIKKQKGLDRILRRKFNNLDKVKGGEFEDALRKLTDIERDKYLDHGTKKVARKAARQIKK